MNIPYISTVYPTSYLRECLYNYLYVCEFHTTIEFLKSCVSISVRNYFEIFLN